MELNARRRQALSQAQSRAAAGLLGELKVEVAGLEAAMAAAAMEER